MSQPAGGYVESGEQQGKNPAAAEIVIRSNGAINILLCAIFCSILI